MLVHSGGHVVVKFVGDIVVHGQAGTVLAGSLELSSIRSLEVVAHLHINWESVETCEVLLSVGEVVVDLGKVLPAEGLDGATNLDHVVFLLSGVVVSHEPEEGVLAWGLPLGLQCVDLV